MKSELERAIEALILDDSHLLSIGESRREFNLFEALGAVSGELRHSNFLGFLLDPAGAHGLKDRFLSRFLIRAIEGTARPSPISIIELGGLDLSASTVQRESDQIDLLVINEPHQLVVIIENKIGAGETTDQLIRYYQTVHERFPTYRKLFLFLTLDGQAASHDAYLDLSHETVAVVIEDILEKNSRAMPPDVSLALRHYTRMMRRNFMEETELVRLAQDLYARHKLALDYIYEHRPDRQQVIGGFLRDLIAATSEFVAVEASKTFIGFCPTLWQREQLRAANDKYESILMLGFRFDSTGLGLKLSIRGQDDGLRSKLLGFTHNNRDLFAPTSSKLYGTTQIWQKRCLTSDELANQPIDVIKTKLSALWEEFRQRDIERIHTVLQSFLNGLDQLS